MLDQLDELFEVFYGIFAKFNSKEGDDIASNLAGFTKKVVNALVNEGFSREEAIQIVCRIQNIGGKG